MTTTRQTLFAIASSWINRLVTIFLGLALMPLLFSNLGHEELGAWILLAQTSSILGVLDFGFAATLTRRIAFAKGMSGGAPNTPLNDESTRLIANLVTTGKRVYQAIAVSTFLISFIGGSLYLSQIEVKDVSLSTLLFAWGVLCLSQAITILSLIWTSLMQGIGYVGWDALINSLASSITIIAQISCVIFGGGIVSLAVVVSLGAILQRVLIVGIAKKRRPQVFQFKGSWDSSLLRSMVTISLRSWVTGLSWVLVLNSDPIFIAKILGTDEIPVYRAAHLIFYNMTLMSVTAGTASAVFVSQLWQAGKQEDARRIVLRNLRLGLGLMASGSAFTIMLDHRLFDVWLGAGNFVGATILWILFALFFLETQCQIVSAGSRATEDEAFALSFCAAAVLKIGFALALGYYFGLVGIAMSTLIAQGLTNYWYMVYRGLTRLGISFYSHVCTVLAPTLVLFCGVMFAVRLVILSNVFSGITELIATAAVSGVLLFGFTWTFIAEPNQRAQVSGWLRKLRPS